MGIVIPAKNLKVGDVFRFIPSTRDRVVTDKHTDRANRFVVLSTRRVDGSATGKTFLDRPLDVELMNVDDDA